MKKRTILCIALILICALGLSLVSCANTGSVLKKSRRWTEYEHFVYNVSSAAESYEEQPTQNVISGVPYNYSRGTEGTYEITIEDQENGHTIVRTELEIDGVYKFDYKSSDGSTKTYNNDSFHDTISTVVEFSGYTNFTAISSIKTIKNTALYLQNGQIVPVSLDYQIRTTYNEDNTVAKQTILANDGNGNYNKPLVVNGETYDVNFEIENKTAMLDNELVVLYLRCLEYSNLSTATFTSPIPFDKKPGTLTIAKVSSDFSATTDYTENGSNVFSTIAVSVELSSSNFTGGKMYVYIAQNDEKHAVNEIMINERKPVIIEQNGLTFVLADYTDEYETSLSD